MNVLILGGTKYFGREIVRGLVEAGHQVGVFTRGNQNVADLPIHQHIQGDRNNVDDLIRANDAARWDAVIDNIAYTGAHVRAALKAFSGTSHYILCSTISVYRFVPNRYAQPMTETAVQHDYIPPNEDPSDVHWKYARGKLEAERECMKQRKVAWTILRPPVVYGPHDPTEGGFWYLARLLQGGPILLGDGGTQSFRLISVKDTAQAFVKVVETRRKVLRKSYFLGQSEIITLRDFVEENAHALGIVPEFVSVPSEVLGQMAGPYANMVNLIPDISAARKDFGFETTPFPEFTREAAQWYRDNWEAEKNKLLASRDREIAFGASWKRLMGGLEVR